MVHKNCDLIDHPVFQMVKPSLVAFWDHVGTKWHGPYPPQTFQADLLRLLALYVHGGIYLDSDLYFIRSLHDVRQDYHRIVAECRPGIVGEHVIGSEPHDPTISGIITRFVSRTMNQVSVSPGPPSMDLTGWKFPDVLPVDYFCPHPRQALPDELYEVTDRTIAIHLWSQKTYDIERLRALERP